MNDSPLKILLAEGGSSEANVSLRTFSTATGRCDQMCLVPKSASLLEALQKYRPDVALLQMLVLQPDPAATVSHLHECAPEVALIIWAEPADKEIAAQCIQAGKELMQRIAQTLRKSVRASDSLASNHAGQFVVALPDTEASSLRSVRRRIAGRLLPFQQSSGLRTAPVFSIDGEVIRGKLLARYGENREAAAPSESPEPSAHARP